MHAQEIKGECEITSCLQSHAMNLFNLHMASSVVVNSVFACACCLGLVVCSGTMVVYNTNG